MAEPGAGKGSEPAAFDRLVLKNASEHHYVKLCLEFQEGGIRLNAAHFKQLILSALKELHGEVGAALPVDVLTYEEKTLSAILRVPSRPLHFSLRYLGTAENSYWIEYTGDVVGL